MRNPKIRFIASITLALIMLLSVVYGFYQKGFVMTWAEFYNSRLSFYSLMILTFSLNSIHYYKSLKKAV
jgi:hypothetical protein